jgi:hypothetical protein
VVGHDGLAMADSEEVSCLRRAFPQATSRWAGDPTKGRPLIRTGGLLDPIPAFGLVEASQAGHPGPPRAGPEGPHLGQWALCASTAHSMVVLLRKRGRGGAGRLGLCPISTHPWGAADLCGV